MALLFLLFSALLFQSCTDSDVKKQAYLDQGYEYVRKGRVNEAMLAFKNAIKIDTECLAARDQLGRIFLARGEINKAYEQFKIVSNLDHDNTFALLKTAEFSLLQNKLVESRKYVDWILKKHPTHAEALGVLGNLELIEGNVRRAELAVDRAIALKSEVDSFYVLRAKVMNAKGIIGLVESDFLKALELNPRNTEAYRLLAVFYFDRESDQKGWDILRESVEALPESPMPLLDLASFLLKNGDTEKAHEAIEKALNLPTGNSFTFLHAAELYRKNYMLENAELVLKGALADKNNNPAIMEYLADILFEQGNYDGASELITTINSITKTHPVADLVRAKLLVKEEKLLEAGILLRGLVKEYPGWGEAYFQLSVCELRSGNVEQSERSADKALKLLNTDSRVHTLLAHHHLLRQDFSLTELAAIRALRLSEENVHAAIILGQSYLHSQRVDRAMELFEQLNSLQPDNVFILYNLAKTKIVREEIAEAMILLEQVVKIDPEYIPALAQIAEVYIKDNREFDAIKRVLAHVEQFPNQPESLLLLGELLYGQNRLDEAGIFFKKLQRVLPEEPRSYLMLSAILEKKKKLKEAEAEYSKLLKIDRNSKQALMGKAILKEKEGKTKEAKELYQRILLIDPSFPPAANNLAWLLIQEDNAELPEPLKLAILAHQRQPNNPRIVNTLGYIYYLQGEFGRATEHLKLATLTLPKEPEFRYHLALSLKAQGAHEEALEELRKCLIAGDSFDKRKEAEKHYKKWQEEGALVSQDNKASSP